MNKFLFCFAAVLAVANGAAIGGDYGYNSAPVHAGAAYHVQPAVTLTQLVPAYGSGAYNAGGYGAAPAHGYGSHYAASAPVHYGSHAPYGAGVDAGALQLAHLGLAIPNPGGVLIAPGAVPHVVPHSYGAVSPVSYNAIPAQAKSASAAAAASSVSGAHKGGYVAPASYPVY